MAEDDNYCSISNRSVSLSSKIAAILSNIFSSSIGAKNSEPSSSTTSSIMSSPSLSKSSSDSSYTGIIATYLASSVSIASAISNVWTFPSSSSTVTMSGL